MKSGIARLVLTYVALLAMVSPPAEAADPPAEIMLFGTFHFSSPQQDAVKTRNIDVTTPASQDYLAAVSAKIAAGFRPTRVLLEYSPEDDEAVNERYRAYLAGKFELPANETYQLGFRIARDSGLQRVDSFDHREVGWLAEPMLEYAEQNDPDAYAAFQAKIAEVTERMQREQDTLTLAELLAKQNDPAEFTENKALYIATNNIGARDGYAGADAAASWWQRNFRMYANIQEAAQPGERVFVLGGSGHIAILADFLKLDEARTAVDVRPYLAAD
jgi:hypothetical protein